VPHGATARLFVAVDPPLQVCAELASWARLVAGVMRSARGGRRDDSSHSGIRPLEADSLHLTVCFLGARPVGEIEGLAAALAECAAPVGELSVGAPLLLPPRRPRALAVEIRDPSGALARLQAQTVRILSAASGWEPAERRGFRAHVTVARMRAETRWPAADQPLPPTPRLRFTPQRLALYRSWLAPAGASYETVASCDLAPGA